MEQPWRGRRLAALLVVLLALTGACVSTRQDFVWRDDQGQTGERVVVELQGVESFEAEIVLYRIREAMLELSKDPERKALAERAAQEITELYRLAGFPEVRVTPALERQDGVLRARFQIVEGPLVVVSELSLAGNKSIPTLELLGLWRQRPSGVLGLGEPLYVQADLQALAEAIRAHYQAQGYLRAQVEGPRVERAADGAHATVGYTVTEGPLYHLRSVRISPALAKALPPTRAEPPGEQPFSLSVVQPYLAALRADLRELGHPEPELRVALGEDAAANAVDVLIDGQAGRVVRVVAIEVRGNRKVRTETILGRVELVAGEPFRGVLDDRTRRRLLESGSFSDVQIRYEPVDPHQTESPQDCRAVIAVHEPEQVGLGFRFGYESWEMLWGQLRYTEPDLLGSGIDSVTDGRLDFKGWRGTSALVDADFLGSGGTLEGGALLEERVRPSYRDEAYGGFSAFMLPLSGTIVSRAGYAFEVHDTLVQAVDPVAALTDFDDSRLYAEIEHDDRDRPVLSRAGHRETLRLSWSDQALGGDLEYLKAELRAELHVALLDRLTLGARGETGLLWAGNGSDLLPLPVRLFNGGHHSVRSYREDKLGPTDAGGQPIGGEYRNFLSLEARYTLAWPLEACLFFDAGNAGSEVEDWTLEDMSYGLGGGLSWAMERLGPMRLDAALNPDPEPGERHWTIHFSFGLPF